MSILFNVGLIKEDIEEYVKNYAEGIYQKAKEEIPQFAKTALQNYYDSYDPEYYIRTGNFLANGFIPYAYKTGSEYFAGVKYNGKYFMEKYIGAGISTDEIHTDNLMGLHGYKVGLLEYIPIRTSSPLTELYERIFNSGYESECISYGEGYAKANGKYSLLRIV